MTYLFADGGSTKTEWAVVRDSRLLSRFTTCGMNPFLMGVARCEEVLREALLPQIQGLAIDGVRYYGAGCVDRVLRDMRECFAALLPAARDILVASDLLGACHATCCGEEALVAILGTGSNSCYFDGTTIVRRIPSLGFILGDEGSGAALGRLFLNALLKGRLPHAIEEAFRAEYALSESDILARVYHAPQPNTFLASFAPFIHRWAADDSVQRLITANFRLFFEHNILPYQCPALPVHCVGSIAHHFSPFLRRVAHDEGCRLGTVVRSPLEQFILCSN